MATAFSRSGTFYRIGTFDWRAMSWSAILAGVLASLVIQILLTMLGIGIGLISIDTSTAAASRVGVGWAAFLWWAFSGVLAAFVGGWVAASAASAPNSGAAHALMSWALAVIIVVGATALTAGTTAGLATNLAGPNAINLARLSTATERVDVRGTTGQRATAADRDVEAARRAVAAGMLGSFFALLLGAAAAFAGGKFGEDQNAVVAEPRSTGLP
jgi:hypothetical protein